MSLTKKIYYLKYLVAGLVLLTLEFAFHYLFLVQIVVKLQYKSFLCILVYFSFFALFCIISYIVGKKITSQQDNEQKAIVLILASPILFILVSYIIQLISKNDIVFRIVIVFIMPLKYLIMDTNMEISSLDEYMFPILSIGLPMLLMIISIHLNLRKTGNAEDSTVCA